MIAFKRKSSLILFHTRIVAKDIGRYGKGIERVVGEEAIGGAVKQPGEDDVATLLVESAEIGPAEAAEGELLTAFGQDGIEGLSWIGNRDRDKRASDIAAPEQGIQIGEGG